MRDRARILIVDDEPDMRLGLSETLQEEGYEVDAAGDGWVALEKARSALFDLALVALRMPGPDGMIVLQRPGGGNPGGRQADALPEDAGVRDRGGGGREELAAF